MFRTLIAVAAVVLVFGAALVVGGEKLGAWESPKRAAVPPAAKLPVTRAKPANPSVARIRERRTPIRTPSWVAELDTLCRRAEASVADLRQPLTKADVRRYLQRIAALSGHWNRQAERPLARAARRHPDAVRRVRLLFAEERRLIHDAIAAARRGDFAAFGELGPLMVANGVQQSQLLVDLGAEDCALPPDLTF